MLIRPTQFFRRNWIKVDEYNGTVRYVYPFNSGHLISLLYLEGRNYPEVAIKYWNGYCYEISGIFRDDWGDDVTTIYDKIELRCLVEALYYVTNIRKQIGSIRYSDKYLKKMVETENRLHIRKFYESLNAQILKNKIEYDSLYGSQAVDLSAIKYNINDVLTTKAFVGGINGQNNAY